MKALLLALLLASSSLALAEGKIATVDIQQAVINTDYAQAQIAKLKNDDDYKSNMADAEKIRKEGIALAQKYQKEEATMSATQKRDLENKINEKKSDLEHIATKLQDSSKSLYQNVMMQMNDVLTQATEELIKREGIGLLLNGNPQIVLHSDTSFDITAKLTERINQLYNKKDKK